MAGKLAGKEAEIVRRYEEGESTVQLAQAFSVSSHTVNSAIKAGGLTPRNGSQQNAMRYGKPQINDLRSISAQRWHEIYLQSPYPSCRQLAKEWGVSPNHIRDCLETVGIAVRTSGEQKRIDISLKKYAPLPVHPGRWTGPWPTPGAKMRGKKLPRKWRENVVRAIRRRSVWIEKPCIWCGLPVRRTPGRLRQNPRPACATPHAAEWGRHRLWKSEDEPRPLILARLRDLLAEHPYKTLPFTREMLEKAGATIGAGEAEISSVFTERYVEQETLARVINAPPMAPGAAQPKKPRQQPPLSPETLGPVGEAILRAERQEARP